MPLASRNPVHVGKYLRVSTVKAKKGGERGARSLRAYGLFGWNISRLELVVSTVRNSACEREDQPQLASAAGLYPSRI